MSKPEVKPCYWCDSAEDIQFCIEGKGDLRLNVKIWCEECTRNHDDYYGPYDAISQGQSYEEAVAAWNKRQDEEEEHVNQIDAAIDARYGKS